MKLLPSQHKPDAVSRQNFDRAFKSEIVLATSEEGPGNLEAFQDHLR